MSQKYLEITGRVPLGEHHREQAGVAFRVHEILDDVAADIVTISGDSEFMFHVRSRTERPNMRGPRKNKASE